MNIFRKLQYSIKYKEFVKKYRHFDEITQTLKNVVKLRIDRNLKKF